MTSNSTSGYLSERTESSVLKTNLYTCVHSNIIHDGKRVKATQCPVTDEWINKVWSIHTVEYYSALKRREILTRDITWMNLEDIM